MLRPLFDDAARQGGEGRVVLIGVAQEKASAWRSWKAKGQEKAAHPHMEWGRQMAYINHYYFYLWDPEWGPAFWKTNAYAPFPIWLWLNGHEWAKRQMEKAGIAYEALDNGFLSCADPETLQRRCDELGSDDVQDFFSALVFPASIALHDKRIWPRATGMTWPFGSSRFPTRASSIGPSRPSVVRRRDSGSPGHRSARPSGPDLSASESAGALLAASGPG